MSSRNPFGPEGAGRTVLRNLGFDFSAAPLTAALVGANVLVFLVALAVPGVRGALVFAPAIGAAEPWRFLTSAFLHGGFMHLFLNMYALLVFGPGLERSLGRWRYLAAYLASAVAGNVLVELLASPASVSWITATVGASGAVFGMFGVLLMISGARNRGLWWLIALNLGIGFLPGSNISWQAHVGGLVAGIVLGAAFVASNRWARGRLATRGRAGLASVRRVVFGCDAVAVALVAAGLAALIVLGYG